MTARAKLDEFREHLPLIKCIVSKAITSEDWGFIKDACKAEIERESITVDRFAEYELHKHFEEIEEITFKAEKKF